MEVKKGEKGQKKKKIMKGSKNKIEQKSDLRKG